MSLGRGPIVGWFVARLARLRFPTLFLVSAGLFLFDLLIPDVIPFADELLLGLGTALLASLKKRGAEAIGAERRAPSRQ
jgi:hypothetical protein